ncbi:MAG TPA: hypothetical protein VF118_00090, partial [Gemmatimonadaceae bacterium]
LVTFHMLTGTLPFPSSTLQESMIMRLTDRPRTLAEMRPDASWPAPVQTVLDRALQRKSADRYQHATDFSSDLTRAVAGIPKGATIVGASVGAAGAGASGGAIPSTAVRNAAGAGAGTRGASMPNTTPTATPVTVGGAAAAGKPAGGSRRGLVLAAAGLVVVALGGGGYYVLGHRAAAPSPKATVALHDSASAPAGGSAAPPARESTLAQAPNADSATKPPVQEFAKPTASRKERRAAKSGASSSQPHAASQPSSPAPTPPVITSPASTPGTSLPNGPSVSPPAAPAPDSDFAGTLTGDRAKAAVNRAAELIKNKEPDRALVILSRALKSLPTGNDSVTAFYHVSEALLERADMTNTTEPRQRACAILGSLRNARGTTYAESISFMFNQYCK